MRLPTAACPSDVGSSVTSPTSAKLQRSGRKIPGRRFLRHALLRRRQGNLEFPGELRQNLPRRSKAALPVAPVLAHAQLVGQPTPGATLLADRPSEPLDVVRMETVKSNYVESSVTDSKS